jgi:hypothetical protein
MRKKLAMTLLIAGVGAASAFVACGSHVAPPAGGAEGGVMDSTATDATNNRPVGDVAAGDGAMTYHNMGSATFWSSFDLRSVDPAAAGFSGGTFDGHNVYFAPLGSYLTSASGTVARYATAGSFADGTSWLTFDISTVNPDAKPYIGAVYDGRYVYLVPLGPLGFSFSATNYDIVARYDTLAPFPAGSSWSTFDTTTLDGGGDAAGDGGGDGGTIVLSGFSGATTDGRALYFGPATSSTPATRYDLAGFTSASSWSLFDTSAFGVLQTTGVVYDGRYVYFANELDGVMARVDTEAPFSTQGAWSTFNLGSEFDADSTGYSAAGFDGRFVYFVGLGIVARYDTHAAFDSAPAWSTFDTSQLTMTMDGGIPQVFDGVVFDGRYIYLVPGLFTFIDVVTGSVVVRYDTEAAFSDVGSWSAFDTTPLTPNPEWFGGAVFDGRYVYFVPMIDTKGPTGVVVRFDAKTPPSMPPLPQYHGSFR